MGLVEKVREEGIQLNSGSLFQSEAEISGDLWVFRE